MEREPLRDFLLTQGYKMDKMVLVSCSDDASYLLPKATQLLSQLKPSPPASVHLSGAILPISAFRMS